MSRRSGAVGLGLVLVLAAGAACLLLILRFVSEATQVASGTPPGSADPGLEAAAASLLGFLRNAGNVLERGGIRVVCRGLPCEMSWRDERGSTLFLRDRSDVVEVQGAFSSSIVYLDSFDRSSGAPYGGPGGILRSGPTRARLNVPVYPLSFNPPRLWTLPPAGFGRAFGDGASAQRPFRNQSLETVMEALAPGQTNLFSVSDAEGHSAIAKVSSVDTSALQRGCSCNAPVAPPGDCPPGRFGCRLELTLDFGASEALSFVHDGSASSIEALGEPMRGGVLETIVFAVVQADERSGRGRSWLAMARRRPGQRWDVSRVAQGVEYLHVDLRSLSPGPFASVELRARSAGFPEESLEGVASARFSVALESGAMP